MKWLFVMIGTVFIRTNLSMEKGMLMTGINLRSRCDGCQVMTRNLRSMTLVSKFRLWWTRTGLSVGDDANSW